MIFFSFQSSQDVMLKVWKLVSALECILSLGLKSHKLVTVTMGKIRARVTLWDIVEESCKAGGESTFLPPALKFHLIFF